MKNIKILSLLIIALTVSFGISAKVQPTAFINDSQEEVFIELAPVKIKTQRGGSKSPGPNILLLDEMLVPANGLFSFGTSKLTDDVALWKSKVVEPDYYNLTILDPETGDSKFRISGIKVE